ncbi:MAG: hypothetical protein ACKVOE_03450 [Rickettsiales bacterium]
MTPELTVPPPSRRRQLADDVAFATEQTALCFLTDGFTDPWISQKLQERWGGGASSIGENFIAEVGGDLLGAASFVVSRQLCKPAFTVATRGVRTLLDPVYERLGRSALRFEGSQALTEAQSAKLESWKNFQADSFVKSNSISLASTLANAAILKARHSPYSWPVLLGSKFAASLVTTTSMVGLRLIFPEHSQKLDHWLSKTLSPATQQPYRATAPLPSVESRQWQGRMETDFPQPTLP